MSPKLLRLQLEGIRNAPLVSDQASDPGCGSKLRIDPRVNGGAVYIERKTRHFLFNLFGNCIEEAAQFKSTGFNWVFQIQSCRSGLSCQFHSQPRLFSGYQDLPTVRYATGTPQSKLTTIHLKASSVSPKIYCFAVK